MAFQIRLTGSQLDELRMVSLAAAESLRQDPTGGGLQPLQELFLRWQDEATDIERLLYFKLIWYLLEEIRHDVLERLSVCGETDLLSTTAQTVASELITFSHGQKTLTLTRWQGLTDLHRAIMAQIGDRPELDDPFEPVTP
jgi:hypothetical protein